MKRFTDTLLWSMFDRNAIVPAVELQAALDIFITDLHSYCRSEKNMAERTRTLNYARHELVVAAEESRIPDSGEKCTFAQNTASCSLFHRMRDAHYYDGIGASGALYLVS